MSRSDEGQPARTAPPVSPEFLGESTEAVSIKIRNRLLNFRHRVAHQLRVVGAYLNSISRTLLDGEKLQFIPVRGRPWPALWRTREWKTRNLLRRNTPEP
jgi:hypothetical protein